MRNLRGLVLLVVATASVSACTTQLTEAGKQVDLVTASSAQACKVLTAFTVKGSSNGDALNMAFNKAAELGADSMSVVNVGSASDIQAAALKCRQ
ncbi:hypothetical protein [Pseudomonas protegens]|jgi:16S rRNA U1498 N3-methylase RsmE|uniref:hypothetical protein n=1 Tax=Pseudomonas protegens TaxID=380021 RepID=UPI00069D1885|nr:hypothetical protein [Pseudomonas protegens]